MMVNSAQRPRISKPIAPAISTSSPTQPEELRVSWIRPDVAVSSLRARLSIEVAGNLVQGTFRYTRVWAHEADDAWRVVAGHVSEVQDPGIC
jgi:ketosteroid isomerase-like protein